MTRFICIAAPGRHRASRLLLAALALAAAGAARAEDRPAAYIGASQAFAHDSNLFRTDTAVQPDKYSITGLLGGVNLLLGRQRLYANANVRSTRFEDIKVLDNTSYSLGAGLDWETIGRLSGSFNTVQSEKLADYAASGSRPQLTSTKNLERNAQYNARAQLGAASLMTLEALASHRALSYTAPEFAAQELRQNNFGLGLKYRPSDLLTLGAGLRYTRGEYPGIVLASGSSAEFSRKDLDLTAQWKASGQSSFDARLSFGRQLSEALTQRDFSGTTGSVSWSFLPTGKLAFNTQLSRDTGAESSFSTQAGAVSSSGDNSLLTTALGFTASYEATAKIKLNAGLRYSRHSVTNDVTLNGVPVQGTEGTDTVRSLSLGATYLPTRTIQLGCNAQRDVRSVDSNAVATPYRATTTQCSAQITLQ